MKNLHKTLILILVLSPLSCDLDRDLVNPNEVSVESADVNLIMNQAQLDLASFFSQAAGNDAVNTTGVDVLVRMTAMIGGDTYERAITPQDLDDTWERAYQDVLVNIETLIPLAEEQNFTTHIAAAKIMKAFVYMTLVDLFGDVPQSEAIQGPAQNFNPKTDSGADVYAYALTLLDEARTELAKTGTDAGGPLNRDIYYGGDRDKWAALANSLEFKAWLNISTDPGRQAEAITNLIELLDADLIDTDDEEFTYKYGTSDIPARSRHPMYRQYYKPQEGSADGYVGNYFLKEAYNGKGVEDPRWRYYFYRQVGSIPTALQVDRESVPCVLTPKPSHYAPEHPFCTFEPGFFGRDHGNNDGGPPDTNVITAVGVYPAGGRIDANTDPDYWDPTVQGDGANGAGIEPIFMSFFTDFMKAEAALRLGMSEIDGRQAMADGINKSIDRVRSFAASRGQTLPAGLEPSAITYVNTVLNDFDASADPLDVAMKEFYISLWGNSVEAYNLYRRTSSPKNMQPTRAINGGEFFRSLIYPANFVNLNSSVQQKTTNDVRVFWDANPDDLN